MQHSDEAIDRVLTGMCKAEAPRGMNLRILKAAHAQAAKSSLSRTRLGLLMGVPTRPIVALCAACSIAFAIAIAVPTTHRSSRRATQAKLGAALTALPQVMPVEEAVRSQQALPRTPHLHAITMPKVRQVGVSHNRDAATVRGMRVSFPAPSMPLTDQEKLLLRIVHQGDPVELAMLDPDVRARQNAAGKAEFQHFFDASPQGDKQ